MNLTVYSNTADKKQLDKTKYIKKITEFENVQFKNDESISEPSVIIATYDNTLLTKINYAYIDSLDTWYFIKDKITLGGNRYKFLFKNDVLMTNRKEIKNLKGVLERQENLYNTYLNDPLYKCYNNTRTQVLHFPSGLTNDNYILAIGGRA